MAFLLLLRDEMFREFISLIQASLTDTIGFKKHNVSGLRDVDTSLYRHNIS